MNEPIYIDRPPRIQPELPFGEVDIPRPPERRDQGWARLIQIGLPLITIIGYVLVASLGGRGRSPFMIIPMALSVIASVAFSIYSFRKERQRVAEAERAYAHQLVELNKEMHTSHDLQRRFYRYNYPDRQATLRIVQHARWEAERTERSLRATARLWERRTSDEDFGVVRLGMGTLPSTVTYKLHDPGNSYTSPQARAALKLAADSQYVSETPVIISLRHPPEQEQREETERDQERPPTPTTHALGIAGERGAVYVFARALLAHFAVFHAPIDTQLYVLASERREWDWTEHLPHSKADEQSRCHCFVNEIKGDPGDQAFDDEDGGELEQFLEGIRRVLAQRKIRLQEREERDAAVNPTLPFLLVLVDLLDATHDSASPLHNIESDAAMAILLEEGAQLGAAVIFLVPERSKIPGGCSAVIEIEKTTPATNSRIAQHQKLHFRYAETGVNSTHYVGEADAVTNLQELDQLARELARFAVRQTNGANLANAVPFLDLMGYHSLSELTDAAWRRWQASTQPRYGNWLRARLGLMAGNKPRTLVFSAKRDGVHGMVAGSTGSGKSELLIALITGMAVTYDPSVLNFVLVDYKGGGAFKEFADLPHCVDIITNLAADGVTRMFTAIQAEMKRRQALNAETGTKNIVDYRQKGLHLTHAPYPFLFIIIDEFAEMIADRAEYRADLESITRVGRAQGVSLILAAQRPSGVTDQMRSNIKFRICLRVETPGESREMLRRTDAAFLPPGIPGRGYLQVGNEEVELIQVAYTGEPYHDPQHAAVAPVIWPERGGNYDVAHDQAPPELYKAIIAALNTLARVNGCDQQRAPWPDFLPRQLALSETLITQEPGQPAVTSAEYLGDIDKITLGRKPEATLTLNPAINQWLCGGSGWLDQLDWAAYALRPVVGLVDNPYAARQVPLVVDLPRGHVVIFGASGTGKTTFIRTLIASLAATHSPDHFHAYILDLGGRNLQVLGDLPHVGAVVIPDEEGYQERVQQILREIDTLVEERKIKLSNARAADIYQYNQAHPEAREPAILVAIDNVIEFIETFGEEKDGVESVLSRLMGIARQSKPYGIHFVISANRLGELSNQLYSLFTERFALRLADPTEYRMIVGGNVPDIGDVPGRGYARIARQPLSFQVAIPIDLGREGLVEPGNEVKELEQLAQTMNEYLAQSGRSFRLPVRVGALPKAVLFKKLLADQYQIDLDATFLPRLAEMTRQQWAKSSDPAHADWLKVTIGVAAGNRPRTLSLEAKKDGVHGMVAGGTGAGKSELLMTIIVGLALRYDPGILNFVLVDYKGGGAFKPFEQLPHCVDTITNLNKAAVKRVFTAISAELRRRQKLNAETGTKDIVEYRAKGLHLTHAPYPHLFIIIDEYAEMITDNPEFGAELDSITRVGRAQGVSLLLAAQRPTGVSDQMRANIKLRLCLRVEGADTSREMLRRSDAAFLPNGMPGRGYLQVGNENIELVQVAYTGETYDYAEPSERGERPKFYDVVVQLANDLCAGARPRTPWPPFLPATLTLADPLIEEYFESTARPLVTQGRTERLALNPFAQDWLQGRGVWHGVAWSRTALRAVAGLVDDPFNARQLPLTVDFTRGHAVIFGAAGWGKTTLLRSIVVSLAATHAPDDLHVHVLDLGGRNLEVLRALPHVGTVILPDERGYEERVQQLLRELNDEVDRRKHLFSSAGVSTLYEYNSQPGATEPAILVLVDNIAEFIETFGGGQQTDEHNLLGALVGLVRQGKAYGLHFVITANRLNVLSNRLYSLFTERFTLRLSDASDYSGIVGSHVPDIEELAGRGYTRVERTPLSFQVALVPGAIDAEGQVRGEAQQIRLIGQQMEAAIAASGRHYRHPLRIDALPKSSSYRQVLAALHAISQEQEHFIDALKAETAATWVRNASAEHADWLQVALGVVSGNRTRTLCLESRQDGVHGMIAGGTGSGKSELLMTLIVGLALTYSPDILNFVLVDYKGGGAFKPFEQLPHCVDVVTNLNTAAVERMFTAINAEIRRRQALNAATGTKDIIDYRRKGLHLSREPYPHLFVIIDEYAEMIQENDAYLRELESITRVGRAQGINLILASQQPKGVTDQMRANIKLRICLRVEQVETSRELLRHPDAAFLPNGMPGRGYLQVGNEHIELIQVAYTGENQPDDRAPGVLWPDRPQLVSRLSGEEPPRFYDMAVRLATELAHGQMAPRPWPAFLPTRFSLESPLSDAQRGRSFTLLPVVTDWINGDTDALWPGIDWSGGALRPIVGLLDDPAEACQDPLHFDLSRSHLVVFGDAGLGKTTLLRTILVSLAATHAPDELHAYVLDLGGRNFRSVEALPHVGAVIYADEETFEERLQRLLDMLNRVIEERQQVISSADSSSLYDFSARFPAKALPAIVVFIDNFAELQENYESLVEASLMPLVRRSLSTGVTFVVACNTPTNMPSRLYSLFAERVTFKQSNTDRYMDIVGRGAVEIGDLPGRGYIRRDRRPLLFQVALPAGLLDTNGLPVRPEAEDLRLLAVHMHTLLASRGREQQLPAPIRVLPQHVSLTQTIEDVGSTSARRVEAVLGLTGDLTPGLFDLRRTGPHFMVVGPPLSGKTTTLYNWVFSLANRYDPAQLMMVLVDLQRRFVEYGGSHTLAELPHVVACLTEIEQLEDLVAQLKEECALLAAQERSRAIFVVIDNFDDFSDELGQQPAGRELARLARRYGRDGLHFVVSSGTKSDSGELKRRIQAANYGIALRTSEAVAALNVMRTPAALRDRELPVGRGYVVKSGQTTLIQIASPYDDGAAQVDVPHDDEEQRATALDRWVQSISARHVEQRASWTSNQAGPAPRHSPHTPSARAERMSVVLRSKVRRELDHLYDDNGGGELIAAKLLQMDIERWHDEALLAELLKELWIKEQVASGTPVELVKTLVDAMGSEDILLQLEGELQNGRTSTSS